MQIKFKKSSLQGLTVLVVMLSIVVKEMMMKVVEGGGIVAFFMAYFFGVTVFVCGGFAEFKKKMAVDFGPMPEPVMI